MTLIFILIVPVIAFLSSVLVRKSIEVLSFIAICAVLLEVIATILVMFAVTKNGAYYFSSYFSADAFGTIIILLISIIGALATWYSTGYLKNEINKEIIGFKEVKLYFILLQLFILAMFFAVLTVNPIFMWIAIEATTLSTVFLINFYKNSSSIEAAWKYLIINSVGLLLGFFGTLLFLYPSIKSGIYGFLSWQTLQANAASFDPSIAKIAFTFVLIGFGTKVGLVPMHTWLPDAHSKAPAPISSLLSGVLLNVALLAVLRFQEVINLTTGKEFSQDLLIIFGVLSILISAFIIFIQKNYKRLLAYSSIEHMGIATFGFGIGGAGAFAALLHMIYHSLAKSSLFLSSGNILMKFGSTKIKNVKGVLSVMPLTAILFIIGFLTLTGVPPFGIFITEFSILSAAMKTHQVSVAFALFGLVLVFIGFLKHVSSMMFGENEANIAKGESSLSTILPVIILVLLLIFLSVYIPNILNSLIQTATKNY